MSRPLTKQWNFDPIRLAAGRRVLQSGRALQFLEARVLREDIVAGLDQAKAKRVGAMVKRVGIIPPVAFAGGVAKYAGVRRALEQKLGQALFVPDEPQIVGALDAALIARDGD